MNIYRSRLNEASGAPSTTLGESRGEGPLSRKIRGCAGTGCKKRKRYCPVRDGLSTADNFAGLELWYRWVDKGKHKMGGRNKGFRKVQLDRDLLARLK